MILDTNAVSAILSGDSGIETVLGASVRHHLPLVVLAEYQFGILGSQNRDLLQRALDKLEAESVVLFCDRETVNHYASIRYDLKQRGTPIPEADLWIAALASQHALEIVSRDVHFDAVSGAHRVAW